MNRLAIRETGSGPAVLLVHGWAGSKDTWGPVPAALAAAGRRCVAVDLPGWGDSAARRDHPHTTLSYADALRPLLRSLGPTPVVAHSMGTQVALLLARAAPEVTQMVLIAPPVVPVDGVTLPPRTLTDLLTLPLIGIPAGRVAMAFMKLRPPPPATRYRRTVADPAILQKLEAQELVRQSEVLFAATPTRVMARSLHSTAVTDMRPVAPDVAQPTLVVVGLRDEVVNPEEGAILAGLLPDAVLLNIPHAGHIPHFEASDEVLARTVAHIVGA